MLLQKQKGDVCAVFQITCFNRSVILKSCFLPDVKSLPFSAFYDVEKCVCVLRQAFSTMGALALALGRQPPWNSHLLGKPKCSKFSFLRKKHTNVFCRELDKTHNILDSCSKQLTSSFWPKKIQVIFIIQRNYTPEEKKQTIIVYRVPCKTQNIKQLLKKLQKNIASSEAVAASMQCGKTASEGIPPWGEFPSRQGTLFLNLCNGFDILMFQGYQKKLLTNLKTLVLSWSVAFYYKIHNTLKSHKHHPQGPQKLLVILYLSFPRSL